MSDSRPDTENKLNKTKPKIGMNPHYVLTYLIFIGGEARVARLCFYELQAPVVVPPSSVARSCFINCRLLPLFLFPPPLPNKSSPFTLAVKSGVATTSQPRGKKTVKTVGTSEGLVHVSIPSLPPRSPSFPSTLSLSLSLSL